MKHPKLDRVANDQNQAKLDLSDIIQDYLLVSLKLYNISEMVPQNESEANAIEARELKLLDQQAGLLNTACSCKIETLVDAKAILKLWHHEVVQAQVPGSLSAADELVNSVCNFFDVS